MNTLKYHINQTDLIKHNINNLRYLIQDKKTLQNIPTIIETNSNESITHKKCNCPKTNVLAIDDEEICLLSIEVILHNTHCSLIKANSGKKALKILKDHKPDNIDLILLDLVMPNLHDNLLGIETLKIIKSDPILKRIPVILQTATSNEKDIEEAINIGAVECIRKPYGKQTLLKSIKKHLE